MIRVIFFLLPLCGAGGRLIAQHPLIGTWEMITVQGIGAEGEKFFFDTTAVRETKIITPTHYMLIAWDVAEDSLFFNRTMAGQVRLEGEKYIEIPTQASVEIFEDVKVDFTWKLDGNVFTQSGTVVRPDGKLVVLEALIFKRVTDEKSHAGLSAIGTWKQKSSYYTSKDNQKTSAFGDSDTGLLIITPTHWMRMDHRNNEFAGVLYGRYDLEGDNIVPQLYFSSYPSIKKETFKSSQQVKGDEMHISYPGTTPEGEPTVIYDVFEKVKQ